MCVEHCTDPPPARQYAGHTYVPNGFLSRCGAAMQRWRQHAAQLGTRAQAAQNASGEQPAPATDVQHIVESRHLRGTALAARRRRMRQRDEQATAEMRLGAEPRRDHRRLREVAQHHDYRVVVAYRTGVVRPLTYLVDEKAGLTEKR